MSLHCHSTIPLALRGVEEGMGVGISDVPGNKDGKARSRRNPLQNVLALCNQTKMGSLAEHRKKNCTLLLCSFSFSFLSVSQV